LWEGSTAEDQTKRSPPATIGRQNQPPLYDIIRVTFTFALTKFADRWLSHTIYYLSSVPSFFSVGYGA